MARITPEVDLGNLSPAERALTGSEESIRLLRQRLEDDLYANEELRKWCEQRLREHLPKNFHWDLIQASVDARVREIQARRALEGCGWL